MKNATYCYFIRDKEGNPVDIDTLTPEEKKEVGQWAYRTMLESLGYRPMTEVNSLEVAKKASGTENKREDLPSEKR